MDGKFDENIAKLIDAADVTTAAIQTLRLNSTIEQTHRVYFLLQEMNRLLKTLIANNEVPDAP